jgi:hypothetical protein
VHLHGWQANAWQDETTLTASALAARLPRYAGTSREA